MKNKGLVITLIILISILILALISILVFVIFGNFNINKVFFKNDNINSNVIFDESYIIDDIECIDIKSEAGDVIFENSLENDIRIVAYGKNENEIKVSLDNNNIKIDYTGYKRSWFNFDFSRNNIIVYIPNTYSREINIKNEYGNCELIDLEDASLNIDSNCGNVEISKIKNATIKCDYGNVNIKSIHNKCDIKADCGNVEIDELQIKENSTIKCDLGNIHISKINDIYVDADVDLGNKNIKNDNRNSNITLKIKADCGNVIVGD